MLVSFHWLRSLCPFDADADEAAAALTSRGLTVDAVDRDSHEGDTVLDIDIPANRPDCLGHLGLARELSAAFGVGLVPPAAPPVGSGDPVDRSVRVVIEDPDLCARYTARVVRDIRIGPSPDWVVRRLEACGLRSINNVVDASNLVLLEIGQPIHTFDLERLAVAPDGRFEIRVRRGREGERLSTLDGIERTVDPEMLLIADCQDAVALGGVMGGRDTEIQYMTNEVLIEAAWFLPRSVRATAKRLGLHSDASHRFERGVDPDGPMAAQDLAVRLLCELAGGTPAPGMIDAYPAPFEERILELDPTRVERLLGYDPGEDSIRESLVACGLSPEESPEGVLRTRVPSWRIDLERDADLVEEVARHLGYERIPAHIPSSGRLMVQETTHPLEEDAREILAHLGFHEAFNYTMLSEGEDEEFTEAGAGAPLEIGNPIAEQMTFLRRSVLPGLVRTADLNLRRGVRDVRLFEVGRVFLASGEPGGFPSEPVRAAVAWTGAGEPRHWSREDRGVELADVAGVAETVLGRLRPGFTPERHRCDLPGFHPARSMSWKDESSTTVAWCGEVHPDLRQRMDLSQDIFLAEIDLDRLLEVVSPGFRYARLPRVPAVTRDLSLVIPADTSFASIRRVLSEVDAPAPVSFDVVDRYAGPPLAAGEASLTVRVILQPLERTLTDEVTESYRGKLVEILKKDRNIKLRE
jgi:phenylalanyl-tRNA synthetase beta chain